MSTDLSMRYSLLITLILALFSSLAWADIPVFHPDERLDPKVDRPGLEKLLETLSEERKFERVQHLLFLLDREREATKHALANHAKLPAEAQQSSTVKESRKRLSDDLEKLNAAEIVLKDWLGRRGIVPKPTRPGRREGKQDDRYYGSVTTSSTSAVAVLLIIGGTLLGLRRVLA